MKLIIGWLYPELMSTYGDRGNIFVFKKRCEWRKIAVSIIRIDFRTTMNEIQSCNLLFGGGAQDRQQGLVVPDLLKNKKPILKSLIDAGTPGLFVCGAPQLLGHSYTASTGVELEGLGIFDMVTKHPGENSQRCIGNLFCELTAISCQPKNTMVGFENHGGRTYLGTGVNPFAKVIKGYGNNGEDRTEGAMVNNWIATYSHGPFLSKNPHVADWLIQKALEVKYKKSISLEPLDDTLEWQAHTSVVKSILSS